MDDSLTHLVGQLIGSRYRVADRIGEGGMGVVYRAVDEQLHRPVAIKFLSPDLRHDSDRLSRFRNEARALAALNHPHIVTVYEVGQAGETPFIATELVEGRTLRERLRGGTVSLHDALDVSLQVARALAAAHGKGIVHRDIKPDNVMIRLDGYVKVLDFGVAALCPPIEPGKSLLTSASLETVAPTIAGTPAYMSPEQIDGASVDARSDIFSLGVMLCETATGTNPFARPSVLETMGAIGQTPAPAATTTVNLAPAVRAIVLKALQKDRSERYQSASDMVGDLQRALGSLETRPTAVVARVRPRVFIAAAAVIVIASGVGAVAYRSSERRHWVREQATPEIARLTDEKPAAAFSMIQTAEQYLPNDPGLARVAADATRVASIHSSPAGAVVEVKDYEFPDEGWLRLGVTPLEKVRVPNGFLRWRVSKPGMGESITASGSSESMNFDLARAASAPPGMVPVDGGVWGTYRAFLGWVGPYDLPPFFVDRFEVTNRQYQEFVDKGGYAVKDFWKEPFIRDGRTLTWTEAMDALRDSTGRPGPSTWEGGHYPQGKDDYPVSGVSWYEASAYAAFVGKSLPVIAQEGKLAPVDDDKYVVQLSNLSNNLARVGQFEGLGPYGTYDEVGNVREWAWNAGDSNVRFILGRQASSYGPEALSPFDRSPLNGFRCVLNARPLPAASSAPREMLTRDFSKARPATDDVFRIYRNMYAYDRTPLHASVADVPDTTPGWNRQKITFDAAYGHERMAAYLFLPKNTRPPFQTVVFFPSARVNSLPSSDDLGDLSFMDYVVKSGRAVIYPVYQHLYERAAGSPVMAGPTLRREETVDWSKDLGRSIDYLETRPDIDGARIGYLGVSQGSAYGVILTALEDRLKAVVFLDGGYFQQEHPVPGMDQADFAPRMTKPVLMINGRYDATFPVDTAQEPLFRMLGTPSADKRRIVFDTPHDVRLRRSDMVTDVLAWYDKYLGRVN